MNQNQTLQLVIKSESTLSFFFRDFQDHGHAFVPLFTYALFGTRKVLRKENREEKKKIGLNLIN